MIGRPGCLDLLDLPDVLQTESRLLEEDVGRLWLGTPTHRHRGDPTDVSRTHRPWATCRQCGGGYGNGSAEKGACVPGHPVSARSRRPESGTRDAPPLQVVRAEDIAIRDDN